MIILRYNGFLLWYLCSCTILVMPDKSLADSFPDAARIAEIASWLPQSPRGLGAPIGDRNAWERVVRNPEFKDVVAQAERRLAVPMPQLTDELYLEFSRNGNRKNYENADSALRHRLRFAVLAECVENKGRFLPDIEAMICHLCSMKSWTLPAHDRSLECFRGQKQTVSLRTAGKAWNLASCYWLLGDRLSKQTRKLLYHNVRRRVLDPIREMYEGKQRPANWIANTGNHNSVCHARVTGAALALLESREDRALYIAGSEHYIRRYLQGFESDGYCTEGLTYWNYGFGRFLALAETIYQATQGKLDLLELPGVRRAAQFGWNTQLTENLSPAFADCQIDVQPNRHMLWYLRRRLAMPVGRTDFNSVTTGYTLPDALMYSFANSATAMAGTKAPAILPLRSWFSVGQMLVARPEPESRLRLAVAIKGGHNAEKHNHNDVGTYVVALDGVLLLADPGKEIYTGSTFSRNRYQSQANNSFGHPVPLIAGRLQNTGRKAHARIVRTAFSEQADLLEMDITSAYDFQELELLTRTFIYNRRDSGSFVLRDKVRFRSPQLFETALITFGKVDKISDNMLCITQDDKSVKVIFTTDGPRLKVIQTTLKASYGAGKSPTRIGLRLTEPVATATLKIVVKPM